MAQGDTNITIVGNLVADPELRFTRSGAAVASFRVASTPRAYNSQTQQWEDGEALFLTCSVWREQAENVAESLTKGMRVIVTGRLRQRSYEDREGQRRSVFEVDVDEIGPSMRYAKAQVTRVSRSDNGEGYGHQGGGYGNRNYANQSQNNAGGFGGYQSSGGVPDNDPWNSAPPAGGFGGDAGDPPF